MNKKDARFLIVYLFFIFSKLKVSPKKLDVKTLSKFHTYIEMILRSSFINETLLFFTYFIIFEEIRFHGSEKKWTSSCL